MEFIHLRLEPASDVEPDDLVDLVPAYFQKPKQKTLGKIDGLDASTLSNNDGANAWRIHGEASVFALCLLEGHPSSVEKGDGELLIIRH